MPKSTMSVSVRSHFRLIGPIIFAMILLSALLIGILTYTSREMDKASLRNEELRINHAFSERMRGGFSELREIVRRDSMIEKTAVGSFDKNWLDRNIGSYLVDNKRHSRFTILDETNQPIYTYGKGIQLGSSTLAQELRDVKPFIDQARGGHDVSPRIWPKMAPGVLYEVSPEGLKFSRCFGGIIDVGGKPVIVMARLITPFVETAQTPPVRKIAISIIEIDAALLTKLGEDESIHELKAVAASLPGDESMELRGDNGFGLTTLSWSRAKPGTKLIDQAVPILALVLLIVAIYMAKILIQLASFTKKLAGQEEEARFQADHDILTGLLNWRGLEKAYNERLSISGANDQRLLCANIGLDGLKEINDVLGHQVGNELMKSVGQRLQLMIGAKDTLARTNDDQFVILRPVPWLNNYDQLPDLVSECFSEPFELSGQQIEANASIGIAFADAPDSFHSSIMRADVALNKAKATGQGRTAWFTESMSKAVEKRHSIKKDLKRALSQRELALHYQPIMDAATGSISSVEALARWTSPLHGVVRPDEFIEIAEEAGLMTELSSFVIEQAFEDSLLWPDLTTAINISPSQLRSATIISDLISCAQRFNVDPQKITIEITESVFMANDARVFTVLSKLKKHGFSIALDDFGTGYSSLAYVRDFPFDRLKIDKSFVHGSDISDRSLPIIEAMVNFGRVLGREIIAEGVETEQQMQAMQMAGCTHLQGWLFSRAQPAEHIAALAATFGRRPMIDDPTRRANQNLPRLTDWPHDKNQKSA